MVNASSARWHGRFGALVAVWLHLCSWSALADNGSANASAEAASDSPAFAELFIPDEGMAVAVSPNGAESVLRSLAAERPYEVFSLLLIVMDADSVESSNYISPLPANGLDARQSAGVTTDHANRLIDHAFRDDGSWAGLDKMLKTFEALGNDAAGMREDLLFTHIEFQPSGDGQSGRLRIDTYSEATCEAPRGPDARRRARPHGPTYISYRVERMHPDYRSASHQLAMIRLESLQLQDDSRPVESGRDPSSPPTPDRPPG